MPCYHATPPLLLWLGYVSCYCSSESISAFEVHPHRFWNTSVTGMGCGACTGTHISQGEAREGSWRVLWAGELLFLCTFMQAGARSHGALSISPLGAVDRQKLFTGGGGGDDFFFPSILFGAKIRAQTRSDAKRGLCFSADIMIIHRMNLAEVFRRLTLHAQE